MTGYVRTTRMVLAMMLTLSLMMVSAVAVAQKAEAHQQPGRTLIYIDGELVRNKTDDHFTFERRLSPGCHTVKVVQKRNGEVISRSIRRFCSDERTRLIVEVDHGSVSSSTYSTNSA